MNDMDTNSSLDLINNKALLRTTLRYNYVDRYQA